MALKQLIKDYIQPPLKRDGFGKKGMVFWCEEADRVFALQIVLDDTPTETHSRFTLEAGIYYPWVAKEIISVPRFAFMGEPKLPPDDSAFMVSTRIGELTKRGDLWWKLTPNTDEALLGKEVVTSIKQHLLPWLNKHRDVSETIACLKVKATQKHFMSAIYLLGLAKQFGLPDEKSLALKTILDNPLVKGQDKIDIRNWAKA